MIRIGDEGGSCVKKELIRKEKFPVNLKLMDGEVSDVYVFLQADERLVDMLNDERQFLPFESHTKEMFVINKASISKIKLGY